MKEDLFKKKYSMDFNYLPKELIVLIEKVAKRIEISRMALVGGAVRDELITLYSNNIGKVKDIDIVLEGSAIKLAEELQRELGKSRVKNIHIYEQYDTVNLTIDGYLIDLTSARSEIYPYPAENPIIKKGSLEEDLFRRDFSINSIAIELPTGEYIDPYQGRECIRNLELNFLHKMSVKDDPTRVLRAARYSARLGAKISNNGLDQIKSTLEDWPWSWESTSNKKQAPAALGTRLKFELLLLFEEENWATAIEYLQSWKGLLLLDAEIQKDLSWKRRLKWASRLKINKYLAFISHSENCVKISERLQLPDEEIRILKQSIEVRYFLSEVISKSLDKSWPISKWCYEIEKRNWHPNAISIAICNSPANSKYLLHWLIKWRFIKSPLTAKDLIRRGWSPGPMLGEELKRLRSIELNKLKK